MAERPTFTKPGQESANLQGLPRVGEVFTTQEYKGETPQFVFKRTPKGVEKISTQQLGGVRPGERVQEAERRGFEQFEKKGIPVTRLGLTSGDLRQAFSDAGIIRGDNPQFTPVSNLDKWVNSQIQQGGSITGSALDLQGFPAVNQGNVAGVGGVSPTPQIDPVLAEFNQAMVRGETPTRSTGKTNEEVLAESTRVAREAAKVAGLPEFEPGFVSGDDLTPTKDLSVTTPESRGDFNIQNIDTTPIKIEEKKEEEPQGDFARLEEMIARAEGRDVETQERIQEETEDVTKEINKLNKQIKMLQADELEARTKARERGVTLGFAAGEEERVRRQFAVEALRLSATAEALQGNLTLAERQAKRAIDAEFAQVEEDVRSQKQNIIENYDEFSSSEKKRANALLLRLDSQDQFVAAQQRERENIFGIQKEAVKQGIKDGDILARISNSDTVEEALAVLGGNLPEQPVTTEAPTTKKVGDDLYQWNSQTGGWELAVAGGRGDLFDEDVLARRFSNIGLEPGMLTQKGELTRGNTNKVTAMGVPPSIVDNITQAILEGNTLEEIRQALAQGYGRDDGFEYLDKYMSALQQKGSGDNLYDSL